MSSLSYYFWAEKDGVDNVPHVGELAPESAALVLNHIKPTLRPLSPETYANGPLLILGTLARFAYVMDGTSVIWCAEWAPGLLAMAFHADGHMEWTALRDPRPDFGGRTPLPDHADDGVDEDDNPLYPLVFDAWDAWCGGDPDYYLPRINARPASDETRARFAAAMATADAHAGSPPDDTRSEEGKAWVAQCHETINAFAVNGIRFWER